MAMRNIWISTRVRCPKSSRRSTFISRVVWNHSSQTRAKTMAHTPAQCHVSRSEKAFESTIVEATKTRS